jgi:hypothetical protein
MDNLPASSQNISQQDNNYSLSIYKKGKVSAKCIVSEFKRIKAAFPQLPKDFYDILSERIKANEFTDKKLTDAVDNLVDSYVYPNPPISSIISFDTKVRLYTYPEIIGLVNEYGKGVWDLYKPVKSIKKKRLYAKIDDIDRFKLEILK